MDRHTRVLEKYSKAKDQEKKVKALFSARKEVEINAVEHLVIELNTDQIKIKVLGHYSPKANP
jgi:hypothetical protein